MKRRSLKTNLSLTIALVVLFTVMLISFLSNFYINQHFKDYISKQQVQRTNEIVSDLSLQYDKTANHWNKDFLHTIGMYALYDGYIVKVYDNQNNTLWDAEVCDMSACMTVMNDVSQRMQSKYPTVNGEFTSKKFELMQNGQTVGTADISYFGPYFLSADDFHFLDTLNKVLIGIGIVSLFFSIAVGWVMAKRVSRPILKTIDVAKQISDGDYVVRIHEKTNTAELDDLILSINNLADSLGKQENLRKQLTADVAHELRTPLTTALTHMEAMIEGVWIPTPERLQSCHEEIARISKLVCDLESLARVDSNTLKLDKKQISLLAFASKAVANFETEINSKEINVWVDGISSDISADPDRISQVLINLLSNAVKYTPKGGNIHITVSETDESVILAVQDNGIGIPEDELPFIFERFYRADQSRNRLTGGTGIGLSIVKSIVCAHGGHVEAESILGHGSCFKVTLPK